MIHYRRLRRDTPRPSEERRLHPFVSYISKECVYIVYIYIYIYIHIYVHGHVYVLHLQGSETVDGS